MDGRKVNRADLPRSILQTVLDVWGQVGGHHWIPITGRSMLPLLRPDDQVLVVHGDAGVRRGDVVVFRHGGRLLAHRVMRITDGSGGLTFVTKGDNASSFDPPLSAHEIVGRVLAVRRGCQSMSLETTLWRTLGWCIASTTLTWTKLDRWSRGFQRRLWGPQPNRLTTALRRRALALSALALNGAQATFCRWKT